MAWMLSPGNTISFNVNDLDNPAHNLTSLNPHSALGGSGHQCLCRHLRFLLRIIIVRPQASVITNTRILGLIAPVGASTPPL
jgi:hypothetical protein